MNLNGCVIGAGKMVDTFNRYFAMEPDHGQPDNVQEAWYDFLDAGLLEGMTIGEIEIEWEKVRTSPRLRFDHYAFDVVGDSPCPF